MHLINTSLWVFEHTQESMIAIHLWGFWIQAVDPWLDPWNSGGPCYHSPSTLNPSLSSLVPNYTLMGLIFCNEMHFYQKMLTHQNENVTWKHTAFDELLTKYRWTLPSVQFIAPRACMRIWKLQTFRTCGLITC